MAQIVWTLEAANSLEDIHDYIAEGNPIAAMGVQNRSSRGAKRSVNFFHPTGAELWYYRGMTPKLSNDVQQAVQQNHGFTEAEADGAKFVVMSMDFYRDMMGVGSDEALQDSLRAIDEGIADVDARRTKPADQFFTEFDERHGLSR